MNRHTNSPQHDAGEPEEIRGWFAGRIPEGWFAAAPEVGADREEILVVGPLPEPDLEEGASDETRAAALAARIERFREETREQRIRIAREAERRFGRKVSWGAACGDRRQAFTTLAVPHMTRLRMSERATLDTLVDAGVARSRSEALAWCVRLVRDNEAAWIGNLREAFARVEEVRREGPAPRE